MVSVEATSQPDVRIDARPILPVSTATVWDEAIRVRDRLAAVIAATLADERCEALLLTSQAGNYPAWIRLEAWLPDPAGQPGVHERSELELIVDTKPFNKHSLVYTARLTRGKRSLALVERTHFSDADMAEWTRHAIGGGGKPSRYRPRLDALRQSIGIFIPPLRPRHNPIARTFRNRLFDGRLLAVLILLAAATAALLHPPLLAPVAIGVGALSLLAFVLMRFVVHRYRRHDWVVPQPREAPRHLGHVDSWHAVLAGLGGEAEHLRQRIVERLSDSSNSGFSAQLESFGHRTANGYDERERLVFQHGQGHVHVHVHPVGDDLFVGWQAHLNWAKWGETAPVARRDSGLRVTAFRDLAPSWYYPSEFDLIDLDSLSSVVHSAIERETKALLTDQSIDQAIDFEVNRGDRGNALDARKAWPERSSARKRDSNRIFGSAAVRRASLGEMQLAPAEVEAAGRQRGLARIPAVILLPLLTALGYWWLEQSGSLYLYGFQTDVAPGFPFEFPPLFDLPLAVVVAFGLWLYAGVRLFHALLLIVVVEALLFSMSYLYQYGLSFIMTQSDFSAPLVIYLFNTGAMAIAGICYLLATSIWAPTLRERGWLLPVALWTAWGLAAVWLSEEVRRGAGPWVMVFLSGPVFMAATFGYWLWRDAGGGNWSWRPLAAARSAAAAGQPRARSATAGPVPSWQAAALGVLLVAVAAVAFSEVRSLPISFGARMSTGDMPVVLSVLLLGLGHMVAVEAIIRKRVVQPAPLWPLFSTLAAGGAFALAVQPLGLVVATVLAATITGVYSLRARLGVLLLVVVAAVLIACALPLLFAVPLPLWPRGL